MSLFDPLKLGAYTLPNRILMSPLTRGRAGAERTPNAMMAEYYSQRADAGLIISEATAISAEGYGWANAPGIYTDAHVAGWKLVTDAVHKAGGRMFLQLWHMGRVSHPDFLEGALPVGPSAIAAAGDAHTLSGKKPYVTPRAMTKEDIDRTVNDYGVAAQRAMDAGFDGVEVHGANGYLLDQFLRDGSNKRTDEYGGPVKNRARMLKEVVEKVISVVGAEKVGVRLSPKNPTNGMSDSAPEKTFPFAAEMLNPYGLAYLHVLETLEGENEGIRISPTMRRVYNGIFIANGGYDKQLGDLTIDSGAADAVAFGKPFIANPDLVKRFENGTELNQPDPDTFYSEGTKGYLDYPLMTDDKAA